MNQVRCQITEKSVILTKEGSVNMHGSSFFLLLLYLIEYNDGYVNRGAARRDTSFVRMTTNIENECHPQAHEGCLPEHGLFQIHAILNTYTVIPTKEGSSDKLFNAHQPGRRSFAPFHCALDDKGNRDGKRRQLAHC
jgi:hypothetical protein